MKIYYEYCKICREKICSLFFEGCEGGESCNAHHPDAHTDEEFNSFCNEFISKLTTGLNNGVSKGALRNTRGVVDFSISIGKKTPDNLRILLEESIDLCSADLKGKLCGLILHIIENFEPGFPEKEWHYLEQMLTSFTISGKKNGQRMTLDKMSQWFAKNEQWLERNEPERTEDVWSLLEKQLEVNQKSEDLAGQSMVLRKMAYLSRDESKFEFYEDALHSLIKKTSDNVLLLQLVSTQCISDRTLPSCVWESEEPQDASSNIASRVLGLMQDIDSATYLESERMIVGKYTKVNGRGIFKGDFGCTGSIIIDTPNVLHHLRRKDVSVACLISWISSQSETIVLHLSLDSLSDFSSEIEELYHSTSALFMFINSGNLPEDLGMLSAAFFWNCSLISYDKFRDIAEKYKFGKRWDEMIENVRRYWINSDSEFVVEREN